MAKIISFGANQYITSKKSNRIRKRAVTSRSDMYTISITQLYNDVKFDPRGS